MNKKEKVFIQTVKNYYKKSGRHGLPWRHTTDPYKIHVSEVMLQQTQVDRVLPKYEVFIQTFPSAEKLAQASLGEVLRLWQGLGYNSRAKRLHECAKEVGNKYPSTYQALLQLPGIGPYTAGAIMAFAYNRPVPIIETNIRTVFLHHFFKDRTDVPDDEVMVLVEKLLDTKNPRTWYWALMDYGAYLKKQHGNPNSRSTSYTKQSKFEGSDRQIRGALIRILSEKNYTRNQLLQKLPYEDIRIDAQLQKLLKEEMVVYIKGRYQLPR